MLNRTGGGEGAIFTLSFDYVDIPGKVRDQRRDYPFETTFLLGLYTLCRVKNRYVTVENTKMASNSRIFATYTQRSIPFAPL